MTLCPSRSCEISSNEGYCSIRSVDLRREEHQEFFVLATKRYAAVGRCIYCHAEEWSPGSTRKLGDEHVIAQGLGGQLLLPEASCRECEKETSRVELEWLRGSFYTARVQKEIGKKKKRFPTHLPLRVEVAGRTIVKQVRIGKYPAMVVTLLFDPPGVLSGTDTARRELSGGVAMGIHPTFGNNLREHLIEGSVTFDPPRAKATSRDLGRMLAKIAHAYAVAELGLDGFKPFLEPIVRGSDLTDLAHYVGGTRQLPQPSSNVYEIKLATVTSQDSRSYLMVVMQLLADIQGLPEYWVVVGEPLHSVDQNHESRTENARTVGAVV